LKQSAAPSNMPSNSPTVTPSSSPTDDPTTSPSSRPSSIPSSFPSYKQSAAPSNKPSNSPTTVCSNLCGNAGDRGAQIPAGTNTQNEGISQIIQSYINEDAGDDGARAMYGNEINCWDISQLTDLDYAFYNNNFNNRLDCWDTSSVTSMRGMFAFASGFDQDIGMWNVKSVTDFHLVFGGATVFNQDISDWDTSNAVSMLSMFEGATKFNQDISIWDVSNVNEFRYMFRYANAFNQNLCDWKPFPTGKNGVDIFDQSGCEYPDHGDVSVGSRTFSTACQFCPNCVSKVVAKKKTSVWIPSRADRMDEKIFRLKKRNEKAEKKIEEKTQLVKELEAGVEDIFCETTAKEDEKISEFQDLIDYWKAEMDTKSNSIVELEEQMDEKKSQIDTLNDRIEDLQNEASITTASYDDFDDDAAADDADDANIDAV